MTGPSTEQTLHLFLDFFRERGHRELTGHTLIPPPGDPVLFTTSGMHPLTPYLEGRPHPLGRRLVGVQRCLRTTDLDEVGDPSHLTVFQMLGSWSLGDYGGPQSLRWGYQLLRDGFGIGPERLHVTVFGGSRELGPDLDSLRCWQELGLPVELLSGPGVGGPDGNCPEVGDPDDNGPEVGGPNWWSNGPTGLCGPDSEIFVWTGSGPPESTPSRDPRWVEVWNHVFMRYRRHPDGRLEPLPRPAIDTGMGLERLLMLLQGTPSVFECDLFEPWQVVPEIWPLDEPSSRVVRDHLRSSVLVIGDGVRPSSSGRGYVLRRLIRRVLTLLWRDDPGRSLGELPDGPIEHSLVQVGRRGVDRRGVDRDEVSGVREVLLGEQQRFRDLLERGERVLSRYRRRHPGPLTGPDLRTLHETHGLPPELIDLLLTRSEGLRFGHGEGAHVPDHAAGVRPGPG